MRERKRRRDSSDVRVFRDYVDEEGKNDEKK